MSSSKTSYLLPEAPLAPRGAVGIVFYNTSRFCEECIDSLKAHLPDDVSVIAVDNGSRDDLATPLHEKYPQVHVLRLHENAGIAPAFNAICDYAFGKGAERVYLMNDDAVARPGFWESCENVLQERGPGLVASVPLDFEPPHRVQSAGMHINLKTLKQSFSGYQDEYASDRYTGFRESSAFVGVGFMMDRSITERLGRFIDNFFLYGEEIELCLRARQAGYTVGVALESSILHHGCQTTVPASPLFFYYDLRNYMWIGRKYMRPLDFRLRGWLQGLRKAGVFLRHNKRVRKSAKCWRAMGRGLFDGCFRKPGSSIRPGFL